MADDLHAALTEIEGIGDARADEVLAVLDSHDGNSDVVGLLEQAAEHHDDGRHAYAAKYVHEALRRTNE